MLFSKLDAFHVNEDPEAKRDHARELEPRLEPALRRAVLRGKLDAAGAGEFLAGWLEKLADEDED